MKKYIAVVLLLSILSLGSLYLINITISKEIANVVMTENVIYGDKKLAEGITVVSNASYDDHLYWDTSYTVSHQPRISTEYSFYYFEHRETPELKKRGLTLDVNLKYGFDLRKSVEESYGIQKAYRELYDTIPQRGKGSKIIRLQDYYDYYPIRVNFDLPGVNWSGNDYETLYSQNAREVWNKFNEYFKIPIPEDLPSFEISISKGENSISAGGLSLEFYFNAINAYSENKLFFAFRNKYTVEDGEERYINTELIPGGYGIYSIDYKKMQESNNKSYSGTDYETGIDANSLTTAYPLEQHQEVIYMTLIQDHNKLIYFTLENTSTFLNVIDLDTMTQSQRFPIGEFEYHSIYEKDNFIAIRDKSKLAVIEKNEAEGCELAFTALRNTEYDNNVRLTGYATTMAFDGERLVIVERIADEYHNTNISCGFELTVYTASGLVFYAEYGSSLSPAADNFDYSSRCDLNCYSITFE